MSTLLVKNCKILVTMDAARREIADGALFARGAFIEQVGPLSELPQSADTVLDARGGIVIPGLINTHHHLYQNLTRVVPAAQNAPLFNWLQTLYPIWAKIRPDDIYISALVGLAEMALSGCTTSSDHLYLFPNGVRLDDEIHAAQEIGLRFHATRGAMSIGESKGGLPPDVLVEREEDILRDYDRVISAFHDPARGALLRIALAPCSPFSVSRELMRDTAVVARERGVGLHTHLAENSQDIAYSQEQFGMRPGQYAQELGWTGTDVWHAHCVQLNDQEIDLFARSKTGVAHCPCSNMRLASGIAPIAKMRGRGVAVGLGVDGSASNDSGHLLNEARQAMLLQRVCAGGDEQAHSGAAFSAREALELATIGGASVLGRDDIGSLERGKCADFAIYATDTIAMSGSQWDPVAGLMFCGPVNAAHVYVGGRAIVQDGALVTIDAGAAIERHAKAAMELIARTS